MQHWKPAALLVTALCVGTATWATEASTDSTWDKVKSFSHQQKNEAMAAGKKLIAETDKKIAALARQTKTATAETKAAHEANMQELQDKKKAAQAELDKMGKASGEVWDATKTGFADAGKALGAAYDKAAAAVKK